MNVMDKINAAQCREVGNFKVGDTVKVHVKIVEGENERVQVFKGVVIARNGGGINEAFTVRRVSFGQGVERVFPLHSPRLEKVEVERESKIRRSKLYYLRDRVGKSARLKEKKRDTKGA
jgi:large subunit ribosomal protein L19